MHIAPTVPASCATIVFMAKRRKLSFDKIRKNLLLTNIWYKKKEKKKLFFRDRNPDEISKININGAVPVNDMYLVRPEITIIINIIISL